MIICLSCSAFVFKKGITQEAQFSHSTMFDQVELTRRLIHIMNLIYRQMTFFLKKLITQLNITRF